MSVYKSGHLFSEFDVKKILNSYQTRWDVCHGENNCHRCEILTSLYGQRKMSAKLYLMSKADVTGQPPRLPYCKKGVGRQHRTFTSSQNAACSNECFLWRVDYALKEKGFNWGNVIFATCIWYWEVVARMLIFCGSSLFLVGIICPLMHERFL